jgi:uncharacterized protein (TIGR03435 family)
MKLSILIAIACAAAAQPLPSGFEVVSIRAATGNDPRPALEFPSGGGLRARNVTLNLLIEAAYDIRPDQLSGGPAWADSLQFTIDAKAPQGAAADVPAVRLRLQALLAGRFHLTLRETSKTTTGYALAIAKGGPKMTPSTLPPLTRQAGMAEVRCQGTKMASLARFLSVRVQDEVVDRTGLSGGYDFTLHWQLLPGRGEGQPARPDNDSLPAALEEQLGLKLERQKVATGAYTIEHAEKPEEN